MSNPRLVSIAERKALLVTQAELDRAKVALAFHAVRAIVVPAPSPVSLGRARPLAVALVGLGGTLLGRRRLALWLRVASLALAVYRIARAWSR